MFNAKLGMLLFLLTVLGILTVANQVDVGQLTTSSAETSPVEDAYLGFDALRELQALQRRALITKIQGTELAAYLHQLEEARPRLWAIQERVYGLYNPTDNPREEARLQEARQLDVLRKDRDFIDNFVSGLTRKVRGLQRVDYLGDLDETTYANERRRDLELCIPVGLNQCFYEFTYTRLREDIIPRIGLPDEDYVVIVTDDRHVGWANTANAKWADVQTFAEDYPLIRDSRKGVVDGLIRLENGYFLVTAAPLHYKEAYVGSVMVAFELDRDYVETIGKGLGIDVTLSVAGKTLQTTVNSKDERHHAFIDEVLDALPNNERHRRVHHGAADGMYQSLSFHYHPDRPRMPRADGKEVLNPREIEKMRVVLSVDRSALHQAFGQIKAINIAFGLGLFVLAALLLWTASRHYTAPFEQIDQGIHEVIGGNTAYHFEFGDEHVLAGAMAQNLNLMVAILTGQALPDEEADSRKWVDSLMIADGGDAENGGIATEPPDVYYRRIYSEYIALRQRVGLETETVTYPRFVEKIVRSEQLMSAKLGVDLVRFKVEERDGNAVLTPVPLERKV